MAYLDSGDSGCPLLFLHGTGCDAADWMPVIETLPSEQRCIAPDFRGHGQSPVPTQPFTLADLADECVAPYRLFEEFTELAIVGHRLGGMVAMEVAQRSSCVVGLVLLEGWTSLSKCGQCFRCWTVLRFTLPNRTIAQPFSGSLKGHETVFNPEVWHDFWESVKNFDAYAYLQHASIPIYEVFGGMGRNDLTEDKAMLRIPPNPNIQWVWVPNAGH